MDKIMANIKAVPGVKGIIIVDKNRALTYELMPATVSADEVKNIALPLLHLGRAVEKSMSIDFFYENGVARLYSKEEQITLIIGRPELKLNALGVVCREAIPAISRKFAHGQLRLSSPKTDQADMGIEFLIGAINIIAGNCIEKIGAYMVTRNLRRAKDELTGTYHLLTHLSVDNNGTISLIKGMIPQEGNETIKAFAHWANLFLSYCAKASGKLSPEDILKLTLEIKDRLDLTGFYQVYADSHIKT